MRKVSRTARIGTATVTAAAAAQCIGGPAGAANNPSPAYSGEAAASYADAYWNGNNPYYAGTPFSDDCTDFVSQALSNGGLPQISTNGAYVPYVSTDSNDLDWYFGTDYNGFDDYSNSWAVAQDLKTHLVGEGNSSWGETADYENESTGNWYNMNDAQEPHSWTIGDPEFWDFYSTDTGNYINHAAIKVAFGGEPQSGQFGYSTQWGYGDLVPPNSSAYPSASLVDQHHPNYHYVYSEVDDPSSVHNSTETIIQDSINTNTAL